MVWTGDATGAPSWFDHDFRRYTGVTARDAGGWIDCVRDDQRPEMAAKFAHCVATQTTLDSIAAVRGAAGAYRWFSVRARPLRNSAGEVVAWLGILTDIDASQTKLRSDSHVLSALMQGYLPKKLPIASGLAFDTYYGASNVLERLGGDWYDVFELRDGRIGFSLGDVCGHGVDAAVKMGEAKQAIFVAASLRDPEPQAVLNEANQVLFLNNHHVSITTAIYGVVDCVQKTVRYASAGHHPPILARPNADAIVLPNHGFPLGVEERMPPLIQTHEFEYQAGSTMVLYTDGLIEFNRDLLEGEGRLLRAARESVRREIHNPAKFIAASVLRGALTNDDVAVLTISFRDE